jgi:L-lactate dehydrogenase complex protein LldG
MFLTELGLVGGKGYRVPGPRQAVERFCAVIRASSMTQAVIWQHPLLAAIGLPAALAEAGLECWEVSEAIPERDRMARVSAADVGVTAVDYAVAETGSLVLCSRPGQARAVSLLPPVHVAFLAPESLVPSLEALSPHLANALEGPGRASNVVLITGPSRTADIELSLTQGVHGPKEVHLFAWEDGTPRL